MRNNIILLLIISSIVYAATTSIKTLKIGGTSANHVLVNNSVGIVTSESSLAITRGGTGAATASSAINNLLPAQAGNSSRYLGTDGTNPSWQAIAVPNLSVVTVSSGYSATVQNGVIIASGSSFSITLPTAVGNTGKEITVYHNGTSGTQVYTITRTSSQTIDGINANYTLFHNGQLATFLSDGSNWITKDANRQVSIIGYKNGGSVTTGADVDWTESEDYSGQMSSGVVTIANHFAGVYLVATAMGTTTGTPAPRIMKNGSEYQAGISAGGQSGSMVRTVRLAVGDTISVRPSSNLTLNSSDTATTFSMFKIGN